MSSNLSRRSLSSVLIAFPALALALPSHAQEASPIANADSLLARYINEVLAAGNTDIIPELFHPEVEMPSDNIKGIEDFTWRAIANYASRQQRTESVTYTIVTTMRNETGDWESAVATLLAEFDGYDAEDFLTWVAEIADGRIRSLYSTST